MMKLAIVDYGSGNLHSAEKAIERAGRETGIALQIIVTDNPGDIETADRIVLPGVGAFPDCMRGLERLDGMIEALSHRVIRDACPFLGICVGMQLLADRGYEHGGYDGLGWISGEIRPIAPNDPALKIPHMGWNELTDIENHPVLEGLGTPGLSHAYFVHSYQFQPANGKKPLALTEHGGPITAVIGRDNIVGTQFHPEKSQATGLRLIANFLRWSP